ncbi:MAG: hypothetical protein KGZ90_17595 [Algoriphagus sp.]|nr:hypothetical protein [Algoriphagus sp.]
MKNLFKVVAVAVLSLGFGVAAQAQTDDAKIVASANVVDQIEVARVSDLTFGMVMQGLPKHIGYQGNILGGGASSAGAADLTPGVFNVFATAGTNLTLTFTTPTGGVLDGPNGAKLQIVFNKDHEDKDVFSAAYGIDSGENATEFLVGTPTAVTNIPANDLVGGRNGIKVFIGGTVKPTSNQASGAYTGDITLEATYN